MKKSRKTGAHKLQTRCSSSSGSARSFVPHGLGSGAAALAAVEFDVIEGGVGINASTNIFRGQTANFKVYSSALLGDIGTQIAQAVLNVCENDYANLQGLFGGISPKGRPFKIYILPGGGGASHQGCSDTTIQCFAGTGADAEYVPFLVVAEVDEVFMARQSMGWDCGASNGEALSRVLATSAHPTQKFPVGSYWLDTMRPDYVTVTDGTDVNPISTGCGTLFLYYLQNQLGFGLDQIVQAGGSTLQKTHATLTGSMEALDSFTWLLQKQFPIGVPVAITDDNQFPLVDPMASLPLDLEVTVQNIGQISAPAFHFAGTRGKKLRLETFSLAFNPGRADLGLIYMAHVQNIGDTADPNDPSTWTTEGNVIGVPGLRLEGFAIELTGDDADDYTVSYMAHLQDKGDTDWVRDGQFCGTRGQNRRVEGMSVRVVPKILDVTVHLQGLGDRSYYADDFAGTRGQSRRLEQFQIAFHRQNPALSLVYMAHLEKTGDTADPNDPSTWAPEGTRLGVQGKRVEGLAIQLTGDDADKFDVSYMAHIQNVGDSQWFWNGEFCGTRGQSRRVEGIRIRVTPKNDPGP
jgi:uncharacterized protein YjdB